MALSHKSASRFWINAPAAVGSVVTFEMARPSSVTAGDVLVYIGAYSFATGTAGGPVGFTQYANNAAPDIRGVVYVKVATANEPASYTVQTGPSNDIAAVMLCYSGGRVSAPIGNTANATFTRSSQSASYPSPALSTSRLRSYVIHAWMVEHSTSQIISLPGDFTGATRSTIWNEQFVDIGMLVADVSRTSAGAVPTVTATSGSAADAVAFSIELSAENLAPTAPILLAPANNEAVNKDAANRFVWQFTDPDLGDGQSAYSLRYRVVGAASWTTVTGATPNWFRDFTAGTFAAGSYEWQVATTDDGGLTGPYSSSGFFSAASLPPGPSITAPVSGSTIGQASATIVWSTSTQQAYQVRVVADLDGAADTATVLHDSAEVASTTARSTTVPLPTNSTWRHLQVRTKDAGLFSPWSSVRVLVSYTPPATPLLSVAPVQTVPGAYVSSDALSVAMSNPTPTGGQPTVTYLNLFVQATTDGDPYRPKSTPIRIGAGLPAGTFTDRAVASGVDYLYAAEAVAANGTATLSGYVGDAVVITPSGEGDFEDDEFSPADFA